MKACKNCQFYNVWEESNCFKHYIECNPDDSCDNFAEKKEGEPRYELVTEVAEGLQGTCDFYGRYEEITETFNEAELTAFDELVYVCGICGWWCEGDDRNESKETDEDCCYQCVQYEEDDEDED